MPLSDRPGSDVAIGSRHGGTIELRNLTKRYGNENVVDDVSVVIGQGEFFSLLGPSGSGKSTTLMMIAGFVTIDAGQVLVDGRDVAQVPPQRRGFGLVFQNYAIFPHLNVFENIAFPLKARRRPAGEIRERVDAALRLVRLERFADKHSRELSGGQQQRVAIARAIVFDPPVVLMDEPLGALDKNLRFELQMEIKEIQERLGMTVIYVTHDQGEAMTMSDRLAIMNAGRVEQVGAPGAVYERPDNLFAGRFLGEANLIEGVLRRDVDGATRLVTDAGLSLAVDATADEGRATLFLRPEKIAFGPLAGGAAGNELDGRVERRAFLGGTIRYTVSIGAGSRFTVDAANAGGAPASVGEQVTLSWPVARGLVLRS